MLTAWRGAWSQGVAQQSDETMWVRLGAVVGQPQAELDGFKSRALRVMAPATQRHLYASEWLALGEVDVSGTALVVTVNAFSKFHDFLCTPKYIKCEYNRVCGHCISYLARCISCLE